MPTTATELPIKTGASALDMADTMFGDGVKVVSATYTGDSRSAGIYTNGDVVSPGVVPADSGIILSTGLATDFTNSKGEANVSDSVSTNTAGFNNDPTLNKIAGVPTYDGSRLTAEFIPEGDTLTMQLVFSSEEYPEWVNAGYNDVVAVFVNGEKVLLSIGDGDISIDNINSESNSNLYHDNTDGTLNTEMDGTTVVLTLKAPVKPGEVNTISISIADGGDDVYDSSLLIVANSVQTALVAHDDTFVLTQKGEGSIDLLANDTTEGRKGVTITAINDQKVVPGESIRLGTGETVTLNKDGTITLNAVATSDEVAFTYTITDATGTTDTAFVTIDALAVEGSDGDDAMHVGYTDKAGRQIDGTDGASEVILAHGGNDKITAGFGDDDIYGGTGHDFIRAGDGFDIIFGGDGNDVLDGQAGFDHMEGGAGDDTYWIDSINDTVVEHAGQGYDKVMSHEDHVLGTHFEELWLNEGTWATWGEGNAADNKIVGNSNDNVIIGHDGADKLMGNGGNDNVDGGTGNDDLWGGMGDDFIFGGNDRDKLYGEDGRDVLYGGAGTDQLNGGAGDDWLSGGAGNDILGGGTGADVFIFTRGTGRDTITDFQNGVDLIAMTATDLAAARFKAVSGGVEVSVGGPDALFIKGATLSQIDSADLVLGISDVMIG
jgi:Ca2+-binding RTX toxin-like protein